MSGEYVLWIATACYGLHILEEYELNWLGWARRVLKLPVDWPSFYVVNALVIVLGACCALVGWRRPEFALAFPAVMIVNGTVFHVLPVLTTRVFSPGIVTTLVLFYPVAGWSYYAAHADGVLDTRVALLSGVLGAVLMACPVVLLKIRHWPVFRYGETGEATP